MGSNHIRDAFKPSKCRHALNLMREFRVHGLGSFFNEDTGFSVSGLGV